LDNAVFKFAYASAFMNFPAILNQFVVRPKTANTCFTLTIINNITEPL